MKIKIESKSKILRFWYEGRYYTYEYRSNSSGGFASITTGETSLVYSDLYPRLTSELGNKIMDYLREEKHI